MIEGEGSILKTWRQDIFEDLAVYLGLDDNVPSRERLGHMISLISVVLRIWLTYPQLRLGQLIKNATHPNIDVYAVEDDDLEARLRKQYSKVFDD